MGVKSGHQTDFPWDIFNGPLLSDLEGFLVFWGKSKYGRANPSGIGPEDQPISEVLTWQMLWWLSG